jgi:hypothetical protein
MRDHAPIACTVTASLDQFLPSPSKRYKLAVNAASWLLHLSAPRTRRHCGTPECRTQNISPLDPLPFNLLHFAPRPPSRSRGARAPEAPVNPLVGLATAVQLPSQPQGLDDITTVTSRSLPPLDSHAIPHHHCLNAVQLRLLQH